MLPDVMLTSCDSQLEVSQTRQRGWCGALRYSPRRVSIVSCAAGQGGQRVRGVLHNPVLSTAAREIGEAAECGTALGSPDDCLSGQNSDC
jgi:hypothetical protein